MSTKTIRDIGKTDRRPEMPKFSIEICSNANNLGQNHPEFGQKMIYYCQIEGRPLFGGNYERAGGGLQKCENIPKSGPVTVSRAGNSVFGAVIQ